MYADQEISRGKRSIEDRLDVNFGRGSYASRWRRKKQFDNRWKHDFSGRRKPATSKLNVNVSDLRFKLENDKLRKRNHNGLRTSGVTDLRQQLSGLMHSQSTNKIEPKAMKTKAKENAKTIVKKNVQAKEAPSSETKMVTNTSSKKNILKKNESSVDNLLISLGLEKYSITFKAEEVDMDVMLHMNDCDLKVLGIPMGPRKKILLYLAKKA
ncbi:hypothetical protein ZOSMA_249G00150 [Zostera marina]|uniref:SAM domain-containing protein n=1 Tax=Zostera marina TaxID=29655 RepID=A0A0K9PGQ9_ZOSMR|nr:hypothetical protein ZOSMA_249G00150 [Zostera marina]